MKIKLILFASIVATSFAAVSCNLYSRFTGGTQQKYKLEETRRYLDSQDYESAINTIASIYAANPTNEEIVILYASAYAGRAGFTYLSALVTYMNALSTYSFPDTTGMAGVFTEDSSYVEEATAAKESDAYVAWLALRDYDITASGRTEKINMFLAFLSLYRINIITKLAADIDNNHAIDGAFDACTIGAGGLTNDQADNLIQAIVAFNESLGETNTGSAPPFNTIVHPTLQEALTLIGDGDETATTSSTFCATDDTSNDCRDIRSILKGEPLNTGLQIAVIPFSIGNQVDASGVCP